MKKQQPRVQYSTPVKMYTYWGGQRYVLVLLITFLCSFLLWQNKLKSEDYAIVVVGTVGAYIAGRTYQNTKIGRGEYDSMDHY